MKIVFNPFLGDLDYVGDISGTGIAGRVAEFNPDTKTIQAANLIAPAFLLTLAAAAPFTFTIPKSGTPLIAGDNLSDVTTQQTALDNLTAVCGATNEHVLTKDTGTGNAIWKAAAGGVTGSGTTGRVAAWASSSSLGDANIVPPANLLTLVAGAPYTLTVPATGTVALLGTANVFTAAQQRCYTIQTHHNTL